MTKTDNHFLGAKLDLRRAMLSLFTGPMTVIDAFAGSETIWMQLRAEFPITEYISFDVKSRRNRIKMDSLRFFKAGKFHHSIIDLDAYGEPWAHYREVLARRQSCLVFLTIGRIGITPLSTISRELLGIPLTAPAQCAAKFHDISVERWLSECYNFGLTPVKAMEAKNPGALTRYIAIELRTEPNIP